MRSLNHFYLIILAGILTLTTGCSGSDTEASNNESTSSTSATIEEGLISLSSTQAEELNIQTYTVKVEPVTFTITAPGIVYPAPENISIVSAPISGRVVKIFAHEGESVKKGEPLLELESLEYANLLGEYIENSAEATYLAQQLERDRQLVEQQISAQRTLDRAEADYLRAKTKLSASKARLKALGITDQQFALWEDENKEPSSSLTIYSAIDGIVNEHLIDLGTSVNANQKMLDVIDNSMVLVRGFVSPDDAYLLSSGLPVLIQQRADNPKNSTTRSIQATVTTINPSLDEMNRSIPVNSIIETVNGWPIIGQNVQNSYDVTSSHNGIKIPLSAVQFEADGATVFVYKNDLTYQKRGISLERITSDFVIVSSGLEAGEKVAVNQVFSLKALEKFSEFGEE